MVRLAGYPPFKGYALGKHVISSDGISLGLGALEKAAQRDSLERLHVFYPFLISLKTFSPFLCEASSTPDHRKGPRNQIPT
jgi:hypothetical protein